MTVKESGDDYAKCDVWFEIGVTIYMDSDDMTGYTMSFPSEATLIMRLKDGRWTLDEPTVEVSVDTSKYYS